MNDAARGFYLAAAKGKRGEAYNLCAARTYRMSEVFDVAIRLSGVKAEVRPAKHLMRPSDEKIIFGSTQKIRKDTGWKPLLSFLEQTLQSMIDYLAWGAVILQANAPLPSTQMNRALTAMPATTSQAQLKATTEDVPVVLLVGGMGTRLRAVLPSTPKPLALVGETPFLELLVLQLRAQGMRRLVMCTGHLAGQIESHFGDGRNWNVAIAYSRETEPLGNGVGALKFAAGHLEQEPEFLVMNGDSFFGNGLAPICSFSSGARWPRQHGRAQSFRRGAIRNRSAGIPINASSVSRKS